MYGDALTVSLFLWGLAGAAVTTALPMFEWRKTTVVRVLLGGALLLALCGLFWKAIATTFLSFNNVMTLLAASRPAWFLVFLAVVSPFLIDLWLRHGRLKREQPTAEPHLQRDAASRSSTADGTQQGRA